MRWRVTNGPGTAAHDSLFTITTAGAITDRQDGIQGLQFQFGYFVRPTEPTER